MNHNFKKGLSYIANNVFLFYNSVMMINDTDPNKYAKKGDNRVLQTREAYDLHMSANSQFQNILAFFNDEYKKTINLHKDIWMSVNNNFDEVDQKLYEAVKNCLESLQKIDKFNKKNLWEFISAYVELPAFTDKSPEPKYKMDMYYPSYTGVIEHHEYEKWILQKLHFVRKRHKISNLKLHKEYHYQKSTQSSSSMGDPILRENDVIIYYNLKSDAPELVQLLYSTCMFKGYKSRNPHLAKKLVQTFRENLAHTRDLDQSAPWSWINSELSRPALEKISQNFKSFFKHVKLILKERNDKLEKEKNIIKSYREKFLINHLEKDKQTECNILLFYKEKVTSKQGNKISRFSREYQKKMVKFQNKNSLNELESKQCLGLHNLRYNRQQSINLPGARKPDEYGLFRPSQMDVSSKRVTDRFKLTGCLANHYFNNLLKDRNDTSNKEEFIVGKKKELGPEVHISDSVAEINQTIFNFSYSYNFKMMKSTCAINIQEDTLGLAFYFTPSNSLSECSTEIVLKLRSQLIDFKEELLKKNDIRFQSSYPIIYEFVGIRNIKELFMPKMKPDEFAKSLGVKPNKVFVLLNSMAYLFPIILTQLRSYSQEVREKINLTYFTKYDLDAVQCICMILFLLNQILLPITNRKVPGLVLSNKSNLLQLVLLL